MFLTPRTGILKVNGKSLPDPQGITWGLQDLDAEEGTGRNVKGTMLRDRVTTKRTLAITWAPMLPQDMSFILNAIEDEFFECEFLDAKEGDFIKKTMYVGDRSAPILMKEHGTGTWIWGSLTASFIEQ